MPPAAPKPLGFKKNRNLLSSRADLALGASAANDQATHRALLQNKPFPTVPLVLGKASVAVSGGDKVSFGNGNSKASFSAEDGVFGQLGVYKTLKSVFNAVKVNGQVLPAVALEDIEGRLFVVLQSGYSLGVKGSASMALAPGFTPAIEASASRARDYAVIRTIDTTMGARDAVQDVLDSWRLPRQVDTVADLAPGTWIIAEVDGSFAMSLKAQYGYTYNWVKAAKLGGLSGDIGLKIELGASASLGFSASGKYALVIGRDSPCVQDKRLRVRLHRLQQHGWNFAFGASATFTGDSGKFLPEQYDKFIAGVFGLDPGQLVDDLRRWSDPANALPDLIGGESIDLAHQVLTEITGIDAKDEFNQAQKKLEGLLGKWDALPNAVASRIWETLSLADNDDRAEHIEQIKKITNEIKDAHSNSAKDKAKALVTEALEDVDFFDTSVGKWVLAASMNEPLELLAAGVNSDEFKKFQQLAGLTASILDGSALEEMLGKLHAYVSDRLGIGLLKDLNERTFDELDGWMKAKLSQFIGEEIDVAKIDKVRASIKVLDDNIDRFYQQTIKALNRQYEFSFAYRFQSTTTETALIDVSLDFAEGNVGPTLKKVIAGDFNALLTRRRPGVHLHLGALTHGIERQASVDVTLPWVKKSTVSRSEALGELNAIDEDDGGLLVYSSQANNRVTEVTTRGGAQSYRVSTFAVAAQLPVKVGAPRVRDKRGQEASSVRRLRVHSDRALKASYTYAVAEPDMVLEDLVTHFGPYVRAYFPGQFSGAAPRFAVWAAELDRRIDADPETANGPLVFGDALVNMTVVLPPGAGAAWFSGSTRKTAPEYLRMSLHIQQKLRELLTFYYFSDPKNFKNRLAAHALLMYAATPPANGMKIRGGKLTPTNHSIHWDWPNNKLRRAVMGSSATSDRLAANLEVVRRRLDCFPAAAGFARLYDSSERVRRTLADANAVTLLKALYRMESIAANRAADAAVHGARFSRAQDSKPADALEALAKFGIEVTNAFNNDLSSGNGYGGAPLRPLGSMIYIEAMRALAAPGDTAPATPLATFQLDVLRKGVKIPANFPDHDPLARQQLAIRERIVNV